MDLDVTVIGGGIVGCAVAAEQVARGRTTVLLEMESGLARATTSRNSEVSHGGMYYPTGSLKARFCVAGRRLMKEFCLAHGVGYNECGKLIVAVEPAETPNLERLLALGQANGVEDLRLIDGAELARLEPEVKAVAALHSPRTGVLDAEGAAKAFAAAATRGGGQVMTGARATALARIPGGWQVTVAPVGPGRTEGWTHTSRWVVNAAGLWADRVAALAGIDVAGRGWDLHPTKGNYFAIADAHAGRVQRLIYPVPPADGTSLGVHVCLDLGGRLKLGPDLQKYDHDLRDAAGGPAGIDLDYSVDPARAESFFRGARRFLPWLEPDDLVPDMSGLRPKLDTTKLVDFVVQREDEDDFAGMVNLIGIESPGLTSAPALARHVADLIDEADG
ncbi:NAD(P)/FAD-dependent oxidoreductase [bacterium]|nr:NAD(P)/FAD-dependent oxidoreductase [bacterium]